MPDPKPATPPLAPDAYITVNGKRFTAKDGVKPQMNYKEIAALVNVTERQVVRRLDSGTPVDVGANDAVDIVNGADFSATSKPK